MSRPALPDALLEAIRYEHWLRFYYMYLPEEPDADGLTAILRVPASVAEASRRAEPHLFPLLEVLQGREISLEGTRDAVFRHVALAAGADAADAAFGERLFRLVEDPDFRRGLDAFHGWVQNLANGEVRLEEGDEDTVPSFAEWEAAFRTWEAEKAVRHVTGLSPFAGRESC